MDCEGDPVQELSAIAMDQAYDIISVYHKHAACDNVDSWSRKFVHGLNIQYLRANGLNNETEMVEDFLKWLDSFDVICMYANNPMKERQLFPSCRTLLRDSFLPSWDVRVKQPYHVIANRFKQLNISFAGVSCNGYVHCEYVSHHPRTETQLAKVIHGYHCSLYDSYELYLHHVCEARSL